MKNSLHKMTLSFVLLFIFTSSTIPAANYLFPNEEDYKIAVDATPTPIGGYESIMKKISYPDMAIKTRTEGKIYVLIYVNESGDVDDVKVVKGIGAGCDEEAVKAVKKSKFTAPKMNGVAVKTKFALALSFKIPS